MTPRGVLGAWNALQSVRWHCWVPAETLLPGGCINSETQCGRPRAGFSLPARRNRDSSEWRFRTESFFSLLPLKFAFLLAKHAGSKTHTYTCFVHLTYKSLRNSAFLGAFLFQPNQALGPHVPDLILKEHHGS